MDIVPGSTPARAGPRELAEALASARSATAACQAVADHLLALGYLLPSVYLARGGRLRCYGINGYWQLYDGIPPGVGVIGTTYVTGEAVVVRGADDHDAYVAVVDGVTEEACVPVRAADGTVVGVVNVEDRATLPADVVDVVTEVADLLARRLPEVSDDRQDSPLQGLVHHAVRIAESTHRDESAQRALDAALAISGASSALLALGHPQEGGGQWHVAAVTGELSDAFAALGDVGLDQLATWIGPGMSFFTRGSAEDERFLGGVESLRANGVGSFVVVPLDSGGRRLGLLAVADRRPDPPTTDTVEQLELLCALAAASLRTHQVLDDVRQIAARDSLTNLGHHGSFTEDLARAVHRRAAGGPCLLLVDLDHFKTVNDAGGHPAGDEVLRQTAHLLRSQLRGGDRAYRIGGDEFAVLLRTAEPDGAAAAAHRLHAALSAALAPLTVSIGHALHTGGEDADALVARADAALYEVKRAGRDGVQGASEMTRTT